MRKKLDQSNIYNIIIPSLVKAVNRTPTGRFRSADWSAMCSFPFPDAIESATSSPWNLPLSFVESSFLSWIRDLLGSNSMKSKGSFWTVKSFAKGGPTTMTFPHSPFWIRPATCPHVPLPVERSATSSIDFFLFRKKKFLASRKTYFPKLRFDLISSLYYDRLLFKDCCAVVKN